MRVSKGKEGETQDCRTHFTFSFTPPPISAQCTGRLLMPVKRKVKTPWAFLVLSLAVRNGEIRVQFVYSDTGNSPILLTS